MMQSNTYPDIPKHNEVSTYITSSGKCVWWEGANMCDNREHLAASDDSQLIAIVKRLMYPDVARYLAFYPSHFRPRLQRAPVPALPVAEDAVQFYAISCLSM